MKNLLSVLLAGLVASIAGAADPIKVLIVDGQNNHNWKATTPILKKTLEETKLFTVDVATSPAGGKPFEFRPKFSDYQVVVSNYNGQSWPKETQADFVKFVTGGGGFVAVHAADNAFPEWPEYNVMIGVGGWGGRNEKSGPYIRFREGKFVLDTSKGNGGSHGAFAPFVVETRDTEHPITKGLPAKWMHAADELYDRLRGPAKNVSVLATAYADSKKGGSGEIEPMLMAIPYEKGRVFHTTLGHGDVSMKCVGFQVTFARGVEWAATGKVTQAVPADFPTAEKISTRP